MDRLGFRIQYARLHFIANNSRFLILPDYHYPNLASRLLALCERRLLRDWPERFGYRLWLLETFVDPRYFQGTLYRAANWHFVGNTRGFRGAREGHSPQHFAAKKVFVRPLHPKAQVYLSRPVLDPTDYPGAPKIMLSAEQMRTLPEFFAEIPDPRRSQGRRHPLSAVLAIAAAATLCGMCGYKAISLWAKDLGQKARARFRCCYRDRRYLVLSCNVIRAVLTRKSGRRSQRNKRNRDGHPAPRRPRCRR